MRDVEVMGRPEQGHQEPPERFGLSFRPTWAGRLDDRVPAPLDLQPIAEPVAELDPDERTPEAVGLVDHCGKSPPRRQSEAPGTTIGQHDFESGPIIAAGRFGKHGGHH